MRLEDYSFEELVELNRKISNFIYNYVDGYVYICKVRSYGRNWVDNTITNIHSLIELLRQYDGENGIVDVFSTNPNLGEVFNYGDLMYIESKDDYYKWSKYETLKYTISSLENKLDEWETRDERPFNSRPLFEPSYTRQELEELKEDLNNFNIDFTQPKPYKKNEHSD
jgi:hypothetical protein